MRESKWNNLRDPKFALQTGKEEKHIFELSYIIEGAREEIDKFFALFLLHKARKAPKTCHVNKNNYFLVYSYEQFDATALLFNLITLIFLFTFVGLPSTGFY